MHFLLIEVPFWLLLALPAAGIVVGVPIGWNNSKNSLKKQGAAEAQKLASAGQKISSDALNTFISKL